MKRKQEIFLLCTLLLASGLLAIGLVTPLMTVKTLLFLRNSFSVVSGIYDLWNGGKYFLFGIILVFSVVLPIFKIVFLGIFIVRRMLRKNGNERLLKVIHDYGRWAMLDVMVVAILIVTVKLGVMASVEVHSGLYIFAGAVLLVMLVTDRVARLSEANEM